MSSRPLLSALLGKSTRAREPRTSRFLAGLLCTQRQPVIQGKVHRCHRAPQRSTPCCKGKVSLDLCICLIQPQPERPIVITHLRGCRHSDACCAWWPMPRPTLSSCKQPPLCQPLRRGRPPGACLPCLPCWPAACIPQTWPSVPQAGRCSVSSALRLHPGSRHCWLRPHRAQVRAAAMALCS